MFVGMVIARVQVLPALCYFSVQSLVSFVANTSYVTQTLNLRLRVILM